MSKRISCYNCNANFTTNPKSKPGVYRGKCSNCQTMLRFTITLEDDFREVDSITFKVNGEKQTVGNQYPFNMTLSEYIRDVMNLKGTKITCREGGCGTCVVAAKKFDPASQSFINLSINTCLFPLYNADQWEFMTVEGVGSKNAGLHPIQKRLADHNGSQCGYCSPGIVMNMYNLLLNDPKPTKVQIENSLDGHICRCTGYRPILDAMKTFAVDEDPIDIEDLNKLKCLKENHCTNAKKIHIIKDTSEWFTPRSLTDLYDLMNEYKTENYRIVCGNTSIGIYKADGPFDVFINIQSVPELYTIQNVNNTLVIGSNITIAKLIDVFHMASSSIQGFEYLTVVCDHLNKVANVSVRNVGTWAGNVSMKHLHNDFPSDVFTCLETIGALLVVNSSDKTSVELSPASYLQLEMKGRFISSLKVPAHDANTTFIETYKTTPRSQNAHAYLNAGFRFSLDPITLTVKSAPSIVFGGVSGSFIHATQTEGFLYGRSLKDEQVLQQAYEILNTEVNPAYDPVLSSTSYRRSLAVSLFYKYVLTACKDTVGNRYISAIENVFDSRPVSKGEQKFPVAPDLYPLTKPMTKLNAYAQTTGEAAYVYDMETFPHQLEGVFILATIGNCRIDAIDTSAAMAMPGVVQILLAKDIPGENNFTPFGREILFCEDEVLYAGQGVGLVIAHTFRQASEAAKAVKVTYKDMKKPIVTIVDGIKAKSFHPKPCDDLIYGNAEEAIENAPHSIKGNCLFSTPQFHFYMEGQVALTRPVDNGYELYSSTQWLDCVLKGAAKVVGLPQSSVHMKAKQVGGAFGGKVTRANIVGAASLLASYVTGKPVRVCLDLNDCMEMVGKREIWYSEYNVGFDSDGRLLGIKVDHYDDTGCYPYGNHIALMYDNSDNAYNCENWHMTANLVKTNKANNTAFRSPGTFPCIGVMEHMMEHVAKYLNKDPLEVRKLNLYKKGQVTPHGQPMPYFNVGEIIEDLIVSSSYRQRCVDVINFNKENRWKKRGIALVPLKWGAIWRMYFNTFVAIYNGDGSIAVSHGGIECGQGISTKVAQVCAYQLGVPMDIISIRNPDGLTEANSITTGGSITSELVCKGIIECCKKLNESLEPIRKTMPPGYTWKELIAKALGSGVDLCARNWVFERTETPLAYLATGAAVSEAVVDVLTGETQVLRTDILYDCGQSMNGEIDIGQAEGAFVQGLGFWLFEDGKFDPASGRLLSNGTWEYQVPLSKDIPQDFRVSLLSNNPNPLGVLGSKCVGEPPLCLSVSAMLAVKKAIEAARSENDENKYFSLSAPATVEYIQKACLVDYTQFKLND